MVLLEKQKSPCISPISYNKKTKGSGTNEKENRKKNKKDITKNQLYIIIYNFRVSIHKFKYLDFEQLYYNNKIKKKGLKGGYYEKN